MKKVLLILLMLTVLCQISYSTKTIYVKETDLVNLVPEGYDPDDDPISYSFTKPLDSGGRWQTNYGDAGEYKIIVTASDGELSSTEEIMLVVEKKEEAPVIDSYSPKDDVNLDEGSTKRFKIRAHDLNKDSLSYSWFVDNVKGGEDKSFVYSPTYSDAGQHSVKVVVDDSLSEVEKQWTVNVKDKDRPPVFSVVNSVRLKENQKVDIKLKAEDPDGDAITFSAENMPEGAAFSGDTFTWQTNYDTIKKENVIDGILDKFHLLSKNFIVTFTAKSGDSEVRRKVRIIVLDANRPPVLNDVADITVNEGGTIKIYGVAGDPDGDNISYSCSGWINRCDYNTTYNDAGIYMVKVTASDGFLYDSKDVVVKVNNVNREPVLRVRNYTVRESKKLEFNAEASDADGDKVEIKALNLPENASFKENIFNWSPGLDFTNKDTNVTVSFSANDGTTIVKKDVLIKVYNKNVAPKIINSSPIKEFTTYAGNQIEFEVKAEDFDKDNLDYKWKFGLFEEYNATSIHLRTFTTPGMKKVKVTVSDGKLKDSFEWKINVMGYEDYLALF